MCAGHRLRYVDRPLVIGRSRRRVSYCGPLGQTLPCTRRIGTRHVRGCGTLPLSYGGSAAAQKRTRSRSRTSGRNQRWCLRANVDLLHRRHLASVESQRLLMVYCRPKPFVKSPWPCCRWSTVDGDEPLSWLWMQTAGRPNRHGPTRRMRAHHNHRIPNATATARGPSPTKGVIAPGATVIRQPAPGIA